jgi:hypothetical protein
MLSAPKYSDIWFGCLRAVSYSLPYSVVCNLDSADRLLMLYFLYLPVLSNSFPFLLCQINHLLAKLACSVRWFLLTSQYPTFIRIFGILLCMSLICKIYPSVTTALYFQYITNKIKLSINPFNSLKYYNKLNWFIYNLHIFLHITY